MRHRFYDSNNNLSFLVTCAFLSECSEKEDIPSQLVDNPGDTILTDVSDKKDLSMKLQDLCQFACLWCQYKDTNYHSFCLHVTGNHSNKVPTDLLQDDAESYANKLVLTQCKMCKSYLPHDSHCIYEHLRSKHKKKKIDILKMAQEYAAQENSKSGIASQYDFKSMQKCLVYIKMSNYVQHVKDSVNKSLVAFVQRQDLTEGTCPMNKVCFQGKKLPVAATSQIGNLCLFQCKKCKVEMHSCVSMARHETKCIGLKVKCFNPNQIVSKYIKEARYHKCRICNKIIMCDIKVIRQHLFHHHTFLRYYMFKTPGLKGLRHRLVFLQDYIFKGVTLTIQERKQLSSKSVTAEVENLCDFKCDRCSISFDRMAQFVPHLLKCKGTKKFEQKYVTSAVFHECKVCEATMLCDSHIICKHLYNIHAMKLPEYLALRTRNMCLKRKDSELTPPKVPALPPLQGIINPKGSLPDHFTTSKVANLCVFACDICDIKVHTYRAILMHNFYSDHGPGHVRYDKKYVKEARYHKCVCCAKVILCDISNIGQHIKYAHGYSLEEYQNLVNAQNISRKFSNVKKVNASVPVHVSHPKNSWPSLTTYLAPGLCMTFDEGKNIPSSSISTEYSNLCTFQCDKCSAVFGAWDLTSKHMQKCKNSTLFDKKLVIKAVIHECKICLQRMLCDKRAIVTHLCRVHKINGLTYSAIGGDTNRSKLETKVVRTENSKSGKPYTVFNGSLTFNMANFTIAPGMIRDDDMTLSVDNLCLFRCSHCRIVANSWSDMNSHGSKICQRTILSNNRFNKDYVQEAVYHKCNLCHVGVLCDKELIRRHLWHAHRKQLDEYCKRCEEPNLVNKKAKGLRDKDFEKNYTVLPPQVTTDMIHKEPINACIYQCDECACTQKSWHQLRNHIRRIHKRSNFKYDPRYLKKPAYYQCAVCGTYTLCDRNIFLSHVSGHKMKSLVKYEAWLKENCGRKNK